MWTGSDHDDDRLGGAIDDVARRMTEGAPPADLRARVLARLEEPAAAPWRWRLVWIAAPLAAAAIVLLIVLARSDRGAGTGAPQPSIARGADQPLTPAPREPAQPPNQPAASRAAAASVAQTGVTTSPRPLRAPSDVEELAPPPLAVPSIAVPSMAITD